MKAYGCNLKWHGLLKVINNFNSKLLQLSDSLLEVYVFPFMWLLDQLLQLFMGFLKVIKRYFLLVELVLVLVVSLIYSIKFLLKSFKFWVRVLLNLCRKILQLIFNLAHLIRKLFKFSVWCSDSVVQISDLGINAHESWFCFIYILIQTFLFS